MNDFYSKINDPTLNGAIFIAVCRGKVSNLGMVLYTDMDTLYQIGQIMI